MAHPRGSGGNPGVSTVLNNVWTAFEKIGPEEKLRRARRLQFSELPRVIKAISLFFSLCLASSGSDGTHVRVPTYVRIAPFVSHTLLGGGGVRVDDDDDDGHRRD